MLSRRRKVSVFEKHEVYVLQLEDIIGLKLQAMRNDPKREAIDQLDINKILDHLKFKSSNINWELLEEYFELFDRKEDFIELKTYYGLSE